MRGRVIIDSVYKKKDILGLDIGTSTFKYVQLKSAGKLTKLVGYGKSDIPENNIIEGIIAEPEKLAEIIKKSMAEPPWGKITAHRVIASLPESKIFTRILDLPKLENKDIEEAVNYEVEQSIPIAASDLYVDWQVISQKDDKNTIFLTAAPKSIVDSYIQLFNIMGLEPAVLELSLAAIARSMVSNKEKTEPILILDMGGQTSNLAIFDSNLRLTGSHPIGGSTIRDLIMSATGKSSKEASAMVRAGITGDSKTEKIFKDKVDVIATEAERMVQYFSEKSEGPKVTKALLCGGVAFVPGLTEYLTEKTKLEFKIGNPWINISIYPLKPVPKEEAPCYATAIGLCLRGLND